MENEVDKLAVREEIPRKPETGSGDAGSCFKGSSVTGGSASGSGVKGSDVCLVDLSAKGLTSIHYAVYLTGEISRFRSCCEVLDVRWVWWRISTFLD